MSLLTLDGIGVTLRGRRVLSDVSLTVGPQELVGLLGANGSGKTTLLRAALGLVPHEGLSSLAALPPSARARAAAWMPQGRAVAWPVAVEEVVALGRMPHGDGRTETGRAAVDHALTRLGLDPFRRRAATRLSGGETARVLLARALAQDAPLLLADEPMAGLDPAHQIAVMRLLRDLAREGRGIVVSMHDLALAARYCTRLIVLSGGGVTADGPPEEILTPDLLRDAFGLEAQIVDTPHGPLLDAHGVAP
ncbi:ABC transporter ATP-binding protein [Jannaschia aquimarina]|uniref:HmuV protein n=1 Tax=Jannaschia aquimarina TaxID=935700 RepID=A0A0D1EKK6_9RHOB|nr:ABC transporter ATP-binding protein [Jannaschia aquimarina]KIT17556.1 Hemin import ATP-binding protein HmuV [Jannaschia aquimarina]SNS72949.1 iron complex transport system ATP-binding protein [Jannaschia aquimarina]